MLATVDLRKNFKPDLASVAPDWIAANHSSAYGELLPVSATNTWSVMTPE